MTAGGIGWVMAANLVVWTGLFLYMLRLDRRLSDRRLPSQPPQPARSAQPPQPPQPEDRR